jgi:hypothetical protein
MSDVAAIERDEELASASAGSPVDVALVGPEATPADAPPVEQPASAAADPEPDLETLLARWDAEVAPSQPQQPQQVDPYQQQQEVNCELSAADQLARMREAYETKVFRGQMLEGLPNVVPD